MAVNGRDEYLRGKRKFLVIYESGATLTIYDTNWENLGKRLDTLTHDKVISVIQLEKYDSNYGEYDPDNLEEAAKYSSYAASRLSKLLENKEVVKNG